MQLGHAGPAGFFSSGISSAVQHIMQEPQALPGIDFTPFSDKRTNHRTVLTLSLFIRATFVFDCQQPIALCRLEMLNRT